MLFEFIRQQITISNFSAFLALTVAIVALNAIRKAF